MLTHRAKVLIIEDDPDLSKMLKTRVALQGFDVENTEYGKTGLSQVFQSHPDLVILDLNLPDIDGYEVSFELKKRYGVEAPAILMLTGKNRRADELKGFSRGADAYLTKPYDPEELIKTIDFLLTSRFQ